MIYRKNVDLNFPLVFFFRFLPGLGNAEVSSASKTGAPAHPHPQGAPGPGLKSGTVLYGDSEELNRVLVLTLARALHVNGLEQQSAPWVKDTLANIMARTPHAWPSHTLDNFPQIIQDFFKVSREKRKGRLCKT